MGELHWAGQKFTWLEKIIKMNSWKESSSRTTRKKSTASGISSHKISGSWDNALWHPSHQLFPGLNSWLLLETTDGTKQTFPSLSTSSVPLVFLLAEGMCFFTIIPLHVLPYTTSCMS